MSIILVAHSEYRAVYLGISARFIDEYQAKIHIYTATTQEFEFYSKHHKTLFSSITVANTLYDTCSKPISDPELVIETARKNEHDLGITINELSITDRHLGRGFSLGGFRHPRSRVSEETSYSQSLNAFNSEIEFWDNEIKEKEPSMILNGGKILCVLSRKHKIPTRILAGARYANRYYWAINEMFEIPELKLAYEQAKPKKDLKLSEPYSAHAKFRTQMLNDTTFWSSVKRTFYNVSEFIYWNIRGYEKAKGYFLFENLSYTWRRYRDVKWLTRTDKKSLEKFSGTPFAFFPLATEPETALQMLSPEYTYQLSAIASTARDLPAGAILAVKEHYAATGRRPRDFYGQITEFKNVQLMEMSELGFNAAAASSAVVTITGSSGFEAAIMGKPVVTFGRHNIYSFLPHVLEVTNETQLKGHLNSIFSGGIDLQLAKSNGQKFLQAIIDISFDLERFSPTSPDVISDTAVNNALSSLKKSLVH